MSVVFLCHTAVLSGGELYVLRYLRQLPDPTVATVILAEPGPLAMHLTEAGVRVVILPLHKDRQTVRRSAGVIHQARAVLGLFAYALRVRRELRRIRPTVVVGSSLRAVIYGRVATWGLNGRFVWSVHDRLTREYVGVAAPIYSRVLPRLVDGIVVNSRSTLATIAVPKSCPVLVIPPVLDLDDLEPGDLASPLQRVVMLGRLSPWKGQDVAIRAFAASSLRDTAALDVVGAALFGEEEYAQSLRDLVSELDMVDRVRFVGHVDEPRLLLLEADVMVHASVLPEPFGTVVIEGMYAGCLVIATTPGGPAECVVNGKTGLLVPCGDVTAMTAAMNRLVDMPDAERRSITRAARESARRYDSIALSAEMFAWLDDIGKGGPYSTVTVSPSLPSSKSA
jgi:glycosyltransferase involved in cell wall biosynthesis